MAGPRDPKFAVLEIDGEELAGVAEYEPTGEDIVYDNAGTDLTSITVSDAVTELANKVSSSASPGFTWGRDGTLSDNTWLLNEGVPSNKAGRYVYINDAKLVRVFVSNQNIATYKIRVYTHDGGNQNKIEIAAVDVINARGDDFILSVPITTGKHLALKITNIAGSVKNIVAGAALEGTS